MNRRTWVLAGAAVMVTVTGGVVVGSNADQASPTDQKPPANTVKVEKGELSSMVSLDGILTYRARPDGSPYSAINRASGTYTALPGNGDKVGCGDELYRVDDDPVLLLCGTVPTYRDLHTGDEGQDVRQLNRNLHQLGYDAAAGVGIDPDDRDFTWETQRALEELQDVKGLDVTGALGIDDAVFLPGSVRISKVTGELGGSARPGAQVAQATSDTLQVQVELEATQQRAVKKGDLAQITLPSSTSVTGKVGRLGRVVQTAGKDDDAGVATIPAYIRLDDPKEARGLYRAPVQVEITTQGVEGVLSVPVLALVGKTGGGFAVEVVRDDGQRELVAVQLGLFDTTEGLVEVEGDLHEGDPVVVPSS